MAAPSWPPISLPDFPEKLQPSFTMAGGGPCPSLETELELPLTSHVVVNHIASSGGKARNAPRLPM